MHGDLADVDEKSICGNKVGIGDRLYSLAKISSEIRIDI